MAVLTPWSGFLKLYMPTVSFLILGNTLAIFLMAVITVSTTHYSVAGNSPTGASYLERFYMRLRADTIFFYATIPSVMLVETATSNYCLWADKLSPVYAAVMAVLASVVWIVQLALWGSCLFAGGPEWVAEHGYCPAGLNPNEHGVRRMQGLGTEEMAVWGVPSLFVLYLLYFTLALIARKREKAPQPNNDHNSASLERKWYAVSPRSSDLEKQPCLPPAADRQHMLERPLVGQTNRPSPSVFLEQQSLDRLGHESY